MYGDLGMSASSLHRESTDSLIGSYKVLVQEAECSVFDSAPEAADFCMEKTSSGEL